MITLGPLVINSFENPATGNKTPKHELLRDTHFKTTVFSTWPTNLHAHLTVQNASGSSVGSTERFLRRLFHGWAYDHEFPA